MRSRESARPRCDEEGEKRSSNSHLLSDRVAATSFVALNEANSRGILPVLTQPKPRVSNFRWCLSLNLQSPHNGKSEGGYHWGYD